MAEPVLMPKQGQSVESCIITEWNKEKGDQISKGDILFAYETDKASFEEEAKTDGILLETFYSAGDEVPVLTNVAVIGEEGESVEKFRPGGESQKNEAAEETKPDEDKPDEEEVKPSETESKPQSPETNRKGKIKISPRAKRLAEDKNINYESLQGSGPMGRIIVRDIEKVLDEGVEARRAVQKGAKEEKPEIQTERTGAGETISSDLTSPGEYEDVKLSNIRKLIAKSMYNSLQNSAQLTHHLSADVRKLLALRQKIKSLQNEGYPYNITLNDMICYATLRALRNNPDANAHFLGESVRKFKKVHLGLAVDTERGLMVPALRNADDLSLEGLSSQLKELAGSCRTGSVDPDVLVSTAGSFTISNLGNYGVEMFTPIINVPQVAILGVNTIINRPAEIEKGVFGFVPYIGLSLTYDHRAIDGGPATRFLADIKNEIENFNMNII